MVGQNRQDIRRPYCAECGDAARRGTDSMASII
jgi:hypothetical protein